MITTTRPIRKLLIANRGEIAARIALAAHELGISTVAVASEADRGALHTRVAHETVVIGGAPAKESYLDPVKVIRAAIERRCDAIHPGYGFLAQSAHMAEQVERAGLIWVGPPASAIRLMGDKTAARKSMRAAGVPIVPGFESLDPVDDATLLREAEAIGLPLMVKAAAGGGGRGMRVVRAASETADALASARREAEKAFGDGRLFLERYVEDARHVEVQVLADAHGGCLHLLERECSIQRRHQKIVEEAPSPLLDEALRDAMGQAAVRAALACGYVNAGTIEFLVGKDRAFYFLEMNTRIQVEHPVTEMITGVDIVKAQLRVAMGEHLRWRQEEIRARGHAIECRLNAEDPAQGFLPSQGRVLLASFPKGPGVRVDQGYESGDQVSMHYDSLMAKIVVHAEDRAQAIQRMERALAETAVLGIETNRDYLRAILTHPVFRAGEATTAFVEREMAGWAPDAQDGVSRDDALIAAAVSEALLAGGVGARPASGAASVASGGGVAAGPWTRADGFRPGLSRG